MRFFLRYIVLIVLAASTFVLGYLFFGTPQRAGEITWGVNFSQKHASALGLNWAEVYLALMDELGAKHIKLATYWDLLEPQEGKYFWEDLDWQIEQAGKRGVNLLLVIGMKTPRWPECHIPEWTKGLSKEDQQRKILNLIERIIVRYGNSDAIRYWQVENEPFFPFGDCPWAEKEFVKREVELVKKLDPKKRPVIISDSGEGSFWWTAAKIGDIVGTTLYKKVWVRQLGIYFTWPFNPTFYWRKAQLVKRFFGKDVLVGELQAEPWGPKLLYDSPLEEQRKTMNLEQFRLIIDFARRTGFHTFYLWGGEWWYWMKKTQNNLEIWEEAKKLFSPPL
jgi:hypothetical protein